MNVTRATDHRRICQMLQVLGSTAAMLTCSSGSLGQSYNFAVPFAGNNQNWSVGSNWIGGVTPVSGPTTQLTFRNYDGISSTPSNDIAAVFDVNRITFASASTTLNRVQSAAGTTNQIRLTGANPTIIYNGGNSGQLGFGGSASSIFYGLILAPTSGTTTITGPGNGFFTLGGSFTGITGTGGLNINLSGYSVLFMGNTSGNGGPATDAVNNYTGPVTLTSGRFGIGSTSLGNPANVLTVNGGSFHTLGSGINVVNPIVLNTLLKVTAGSGVTLAGPVSGNGGFQLQNGGIFSSVGLTLNTAATNTGALTIDQGALRTLNQPTFTITENGSMNQATAINLGFGGTLKLTGNSVNTRLPNAPLTIDGGNIELAGTDGTQLAETLGNVTATSLSGFVLGRTLGVGPTTSSLTLGTLSRVDNATLIFRGPWRTFSDGGRTGTLTFADGLTAFADPALPGNAQNDPIVPFAVGDPGFQNYGGGQALVSYDASGVRLIAYTDATNVYQQNGGAANTSTVLPWDTGANNRNVHVQGRVQLDSNVRVNSLVLAGDDILSSTFFTGTGTLTVNSGCVNIGGNTLLGPSVNFNGPTIDFGARTGYFHVGANTTFSTGSSITGSGGVVLSGVTGVTPIFALDSGSLDNNFTGGLYINGAVARFARQEQLGAAGQPIVLNGGSMYYGLANAGTYTFGRPIRLGPAGGGLFALTGTTLEITSTISGTGGLTIAPASNAGTLKLSGNNTFTGPVTIFGSGSPTSPNIVNVTTDANLGQASEIRLCGGTLQAGGNGTISRKLSFYSGGNVFDTNGFDQTFSGEMFQSVQLFRTLAKVGSGTLTLAGNSPYWSGHLAVDAGVLAIGGNGQLPQTLSMTTNNAGEFRIDNTASNNPDRMGDLTHLYLNPGGTFRFVGASGAASTETIGSIQIGVAGSGTVAVDAGAGGSAVLTSSIKLTGPGSLVKTGTGTLELAVAGDLSGGVDVQGGTLRVTNPSGSATGPSTVTIASGATLEGTGAVGGTLVVNAGGTISGGRPGSVGTLAGDGSVSIAGTLEATVQGATADRMVVGGPLSLEPGATLRLPATNQFNSGATYTLITYADTLSGAFTSVTGLSPGTYTISYGTGFNSAITLTYSGNRCGLSDVAGANQSIGSDGNLTADDIIVFLSWYFAGDQRADVAGPNQSTIPDSAFTADDIIVFLGRYFAGC